MDMSEDEIQPECKTRYKRYRKLIAIIIVVALVAIGVSMSTLILGSNINVQPLGKLVDPISGSWGINPGGYVIDKWNDDPIDLDFELFSNNHNDTFLVDGVEHPSGMFTYTFNGDNTNFIVSKVSSNFLQSELLCKIKIKNE